MNGKQSIVFFSVLVAFFFFVLVYNVSAQGESSVKPVIRQNDTIYAKTAITLSSNFNLNSIAKTDINAKPKYTPRPKPSGAPKIIKKDKEIDALYAKAGK